MTRRVNTRLTDADVGRLLAHMPEPPPPSADLTDRIVANAIAASATRPRRAPPRVGRRIWWAIAILGAAGAVTAAAANAGRFELARVLQWPQEIVRAAGWAPHHPRGPLLVRGERRTTPRTEAGVFAPTVSAGARPLPPHALDHGERIAPIIRPRPPRFAGADRIATRALPRLHAEARFAHRRATASVAPARTDRGFAAPLAHRPVIAEPTTAPAARGDVERAAKDDALRFHDADEYARRQAASDHDWRARDDEPRRPWAADAGDRRWMADRGDRRWAAGGVHRWAGPQGWRRRVDNRLFHPFRPHPPRGRRR